MIKPIITRLLRIRFKYLELLYQKRIFTGVLLVEVLQMMETLILSSLRAMFSWTVSTRSGVITIHFQVQFYSKFVIIIKKMAVNLLTTKISLIRQLTK